MRPRVFVLSALLAGCVPEKSASSASEASTSAASGTETSESHESFDMHLRLPECVETLTRSTPRRLLAMDAR